MSKERVNLSAYFGWIIIGAFLIASLFYPSWFVLRRAFLVDGNFSLLSFATLLNDEFARVAVMNSVTVAILSCLFTWVFAVPIALAMERLRFKGKTFFEMLILAPLFMPPFVGVVGLRGLFTSLISPQSSGSLVLIALLQALHFYPLMYLNFRAILVSIPSGLHEAAAISGASLFALWRKIDYGLLRGAVVGSTIFVFVGSMTDVGTPLLFERRDVIATTIFQTLIDHPPQGAGYALCVLVLLVSVISFLFVSIFEQKFPGVVEARISRIPVEQRAPNNLLFISLIFFTVLVSFIGVLPHVSVGLLAFSDFWFLTPLPSSYTMSHFLEVFAHPLSRGSLMYSIGLATFSSVLCLLIGVWVVWRSARSGTVIDRFIESACILPLAVPGIVIAFGMVLGFGGTWIDNRQNPTYLLIMAYTVRKLPFMIRVAKSAILQIPKGLEEAAFLAGGSTFIVLRKIVAPLLRPALVAGLFLSFTGALLEVSDSLLLPMEEKFYPIAKALYGLQARPDGVSLSAAYALIVMIAVIGLLLIAARVSGRKLSELLRGTV